MKQPTNFGKEYFAKNYANYKLQNPTYKSNAVLRLIKKYKPNTSSKKSLLDIGCAYCAFLNAAKNKGYSVQGCDLGKDVINVSKNKFKLKNCGITKLNYSKNEFDIVTVLDVIEHVPDYNKAFSELKRTMKKDGVVIFVMPVYDGLVGKIVEKLDKDSTHINKFGRDEWINILSKEFEILEWYGIFRYFLLSKLYINLPTKIFRKYTPAIMIACRKK